MAITRRTMDAARAVFGLDSKVIDGGVQWLGLADSSYQPDNRWR